MTRSTPRPLEGTLAACVTPLRDGGARPDEGAIAGLTERYVAAGIEGIMALGSTGEGIMLEPAERRRLAELFVEAASGRLLVAVHCGAQSTPTSVALAEHAAGVGVDAVTAIGPPYYQFDPSCLLAHFEAIAAACDPIPFYLYEYADRSGYAITTDLIGRLREAAPNFLGMKVSDAPFERLEPYLLPYLDIFVGPENLLYEAIAKGATGAVSMLAAAFPEAVAAVVREPSEAGAARLDALRLALDRFPSQSALKFLLTLQGVEIDPACRAPLQTLDREARTELERLAADPENEIGAEMAKVASR